MRGVQSTPRMAKVIFPNNVRSCLGSQSTFLSVFTDSSARRKMLDWDRLQIWPSEWSLQILTPDLTFVFCGPSGLSRKSRKLPSSLWLEICIGDLASGLSNVDQAEPAPERRRIALPPDLQFTPLRKVKYKRLVALTFVLLRDSACFLGPFYLPV